MDHFDKSFASSIFSKRWELANNGFMGVVHLPVSLGWPRPAPHCPCSPLPTTPSHHRRAWPPRPLQDPQRMPNAHQLLPLHLHTLASRSTGYPTSPLSSLNTVSTATSASSPYISIILLAEAIDNYDGALTNLRTPHLRKASQPGGPSARYRPPNEWTHTSCASLTMCQSG